MSENRLYLWEAHSSFLKFSGMVAEIQNVFISTKISIAGARPTDKSPISPYADFPTDQAWLIIEPPIPTGIYHPWLLERIPRVATCATLQATLQAAFNTVDKLGKTEVPPELDATDDNAVAAHVTAALAFTAVYLASVPAMDAYDTIGVLCSETDCPRASLIRFSRNMTI